MASIFSSTSVGNFLFETIMKSGGCVRSSSNKVESNLGSEIVTLNNAKQCSDPDCSYFKNKNL